MSFLKVATVNARDAESNADILTRLRNDAVQVVIIKNLFTSPECDAIVADLENNRHHFPKTYFPEAFRSFFFGANLNLADPELRDYFGSTPAFREALEALMKPVGGFQARVFDILAKLDGGRRYMAAPGPSSDQAYMPTTIRGHLEGGFIPAHFDNEQFLRPSFQHLTPLIEGDLFSFVITLHRASQGGALEVYDATADRLGDRFKNRDGQSPRPDLSGCDRMSFDVADGTMVVLRSGRYLHRLSPVGGGRISWTFCSFMAPSRAGDAIFCWG